MKEQRLKNLIWVSLVLLIIVGSFIRLYNLGAPSFWIDELNHFYAGESILAGQEPQLPSGVHYNRAALYNYAVAASMKLFGTGEFGARFPSALFGILSIPLVFFITRRFFDEKVAILATIFVTFSPFEIGWSRISKMYTLFQFLYLAAFYTFYRGFESIAENEQTSTKNVLGINWVWLLLTFFVLAISMSVQQLTVLFAFAIFIYLALMVVVIAYRDKGAGLLRSRYFILLTVGCVTGLVIIGLIPEIRARMEFLFNYHPLWAQGGGGKLLYFEFFMSKHRFPLGALFLIGTIQILMRFEKRHYYTLIHLLIPLVFLSFLIKTRVDRYILNLFPLFCMIAASGLVNIIQSEKLSLKAFFHNHAQLPRLISWERFQTVVVILFLSWIPVSRWFYDALKIPTLKSGKQYIGEHYTNGAVTHRAWREASNYIKSEGKPDDIIMTTHAINAGYYCGKVDFTIYSGDIGLFREAPVDSNNFKLEPYANAAVVEHLSQFKKIIAENPRGWLLADKYRLSTVIPERISNFVKSGFLKQHHVDTNNTIFVFGWDREADSGMLINN